MRTVLPLLFLLSACTGCLTPPQKYDVTGGLPVEGKAVGNAPADWVEERDETDVARAARMAALLEAMAVWSESFEAIRADVAASDDELPIELYDPENPPPLLDNLVVYQGPVEQAAEQLSFRLQTTGRGGREGTEARSGFRTQSSLRPGVEFTHQSDWDELGVAVGQVSRLEITGASGYYQPQVVEVRGGELVATDAEVLPIEYVENLLSGHAIGVAFTDLGGGRASAKLTRVFEAP